MSEDQKSEVVIFGDNHLHDRDRVESRLKDAISESIEVSVIEFPPKSLHYQKVSNWILIKNIPTTLFSILSFLGQIIPRRRSQRVIAKSDETIAEEVSDELNLDKIYTDISQKQGFAEQPIWLTLLSWLSIFIIIFGGAIHPGLILIGIFLFLITPFVTHQVFNRMRERYFLKDIQRAAENYSGIVIFTGDSHVERLESSLNSSPKIELKDSSRP